MSTRFVLYPYDWQVTVFYLDLQQPGDVGEIHRTLALLRYDGQDREAIEDILAGKRNTGLTYSDTHARRTLVLIGKTTSPEQCADTIIHERLHLAMHICKTLGIDPFSERAAYLSGTIGAHMYRSARVLLCKECRRKALLNS